MIGPAGHLLSAGDEHGLDGDAKLEALESWCESDAGVNPFRAARVVVPRDILREAYSVVEDVSIPLQVTEMDQRIAVPQNAAPPETNAVLPVVDTDLVDPGVVDGLVPLPAGLIGGQPVQRLRRGFHTAG